MLTHQDIRRFYDEAKALGYAMSPWPDKQYFLMQTGEFVKLAAEIAESEPKVGLEVGLGAGGTHYVFSRVVSELFVSVDRERILSFGKRGNAAVKSRRGWLRAQAFGERSVLVVGAGSETKHTIEVVAAILNGQPLDFLYIDGNHTDPGPRVDLTSYGAMVRVGGLIGMHDVIRNREKGAAIVLAEVKAGRHEGIEHLWTEYNSSLFRKVAEAGDAGDE